MSEFILGVIMLIQYFTSKLTMIYSPPDINLIIRCFSDGNEEREIAFALYCNASGKSWGADNLSYCILCTFDINYSSWDT